MGHRLRFAPQIFLATNYTNEHEWETVVFATDARMGTDKIITCGNLIFVEEGN